MARVVYDNAEAFAVEAVDETGMGTVEGKILKQKSAMTSQWCYTRDKKSTGVIGWEQGKLDVDCILKIAKPVGVVAAVMPVTNPTTTMGANAMYALKSGNAIIMCPHPRAKNVSLHCAGLMRQALEQIGLPANLVQCVEEPSIDMTGAVMHAADVVVATGGTGMVVAANSSGNPSLGVGQGNCQVVIDKGMNSYFEKLAQAAITNRAWDSGIPCTGEQTIIMPACDSDEIVAAFERNGAVVVTDPEPIDKLRKLLFIEKNGKLSPNPDWVGQSAQAIGVDVPAGKKTLLARTGGRPVTVAVAAAAEEHTLEAVTDAWCDGFVDPILVGDRAEILAILSRLGRSVPEEKILHVPDRLDAARQAVALVREGCAGLLMKGLLNTSEILRAVLNKECGMPHGPLLVDMALVLHPGYHKVFALCDGGIIPDPTLEQKVMEIRMVTDALRAMGCGDDVKVGVLCANELPNPKIREFADAVELKKMYEQGMFPGCILEGPISLDLAMSPEAASIKGYTSPVAGDVDFLLMPNLVTGNVYSKSIEMMGATLIPIVLGAMAPIVLTSRAATKMEKYYALAVGSAMVQKKGDAQ